MDVIPEKWQEDPPQQQAQSILSLGTVVWTQKKIKKRFRLS
jgi:hypothetical protein